MLTGGPPCSHCQVFLLFSPLPDARGRGKKLFARGSSPIGWTEKQEAPLAALADTCMLRTKKMLRSAGIVKKSASKSHWTR